MYEQRKFIIIPADQAYKIDFSQVEETSSILSTSAWSKSIDEV